MAQICDLFLQTIQRVMQIMPIFASTKVGMSNMHHLAYVGTLQDVHLVDFLEQLHHTGLHG
uniref:Uncharacterized protein n=1 Tax=Arundo donax TaxID=35708 RepID=A0A0A8YQK7_ARUDO